MLAINLPGIKDTYIYENEKDYYSGYQEAYFALTTKKAGWDCLRHYEIMANDCIPYFPDIHHCPKMTMANFPKDLIIAGNKMYVSGFNSFHELKWNKLKSDLKKYAIDNLTTGSLADYIINITNGKFNS